MGTPFLMPSLSPTMTEGGIVVWRKKEGETVRAGEILVEIETDKAVMEVEAPSDGILDRILQPAGDGMVAVGTPIATMRGAGEAPASSPAREPVIASAPDAIPVASTAAAPGDRKFVTPVARRLAADLGVDVQAVKGSGPGGRVVKADVEAAARNRAGSEAVPAPAHSRQTIPHFSLTVDCQVDGLVQWKQELASEGLRLTLNDFVVAACAKALKRVPRANATWIDNAMVLHDDADISVAVSTPNGFIAPIVFKAQDKSLRELSAEIRTLADAAREGTLAPRQYQGGTFSVANLGKWGIREFTAIVNPPQTCILAVGAAEPRPVVRDGALAVATVMSCTLSADHRVIDGVTAAEFLAQVKRSLEWPLTMLL